MRRGKYCVSLCVCVSVFVYIMYKTYISKYIYHTYMCYICVPVREGNGFVIINYAMFA